MEIALNTGDKIWAAKINTFTQTNSNALYKLYHCGDELDIT